MWKFYESKRNQAAAPERSSQEGFINRCQRVHRFITQSSTSLKFAVEIESPSQDLSEVCLQACGALGPAKSIRLRRPRWTSFGWKRTVLRKIQKTQSIPMRTPEAFPFARTQFGHGLRRADWSCERESDYECGACVPQVGLRSRGPARTGKAPEPGNFHSVSKGIPTCPESTTIWT